MDCLQITKLGEGLWQFHEEDEVSNVDAYLVCGQSRAVMIDSLQEVTGLYGKARELTPLPLDLVLTHAHLDHVGLATREFKEAGCAVYLKEEDEPLLGTLGCQSFPAGYFQDLKPGHVFDLGGRSLELILVPGHTPGSIALLDRARHLLFTGDSIGSGPFWLQLPHSLSMETFVRSGTALLEAVEEMDDLLILPGHRAQSPVPLGLRYLKDILETAQLILNGTLQGEPEVINFMGAHMENLSAKHKSMLGFSYCPDRLYDV